MLSCEVSGGGGILFQGPSLSGLKQHVIIYQCSYSNSRAEFGPSCPDSPTRFSISAKNLSVFFLRSWHSPSLSLFQCDCHHFCRLSLLPPQGKLSSHFRQVSIFRQDRVGSVASCSLYKGQSLPSVIVYRKGEACAKSLALLIPQSLSTPQHTHSHWGILPGFHSFQLSKPSNHSADKGVWWKGCELQLQMPCSSKTIHMKKL